MFLWLLTFYSNLYLIECNCIQGFQPNIEFQMKQLLLEKKTENSWMFGLDTCAEVWWRAERSELLLYKYLSWANQICGIVNRK